MARKKKKRKDIRSRSRSDIPGSFTTSENSQLGGASSSPLGGASVSQDGLYCSTKKFCHTDHLTVLDLINLTEDINGRMKNKKCFVCFCCKDSRQYIIVRHIHYMLIEAQCQHHKRKRSRNKNVLLGLYTERKKPLHKCALNCYQHRSNGTFGQQINNDLIVKEKQNSYTEGNTVLKLLDESVCILFCYYSKNQEHFVQGTGFVLFANYILTNAHLFKDKSIGSECIALFNNGSRFKVKDLVAHNFSDLDYAVLELELEAQNKIVPPGLLNRFGPMPLSGNLCVTGFPSGQKEIEIVRIIEPLRRRQFVNEELQQVKDPSLVCQILINQGIQDIMMDGKKADAVVTYKSSMYYGSSGSPVFNDHYQLIGLHTRGYDYGPEGDPMSLLECAQAVLSIFEDFVIQLRKNRNYELLNRIKEVAKGNIHLEGILEYLRLNLTWFDGAEPADPKECSDVDEPMEID